MKIFQQILLSTFLICLTLTSVSQPLLEYKDNERVFVIGVRYFENPVFVEAQGINKSFISEKNNLFEYANKSDEFYELFWEYQPEIYLLLEDESYIDTLVIPQLSDTSLISIIKQQYVWAGFGGFHSNYVEKEKHQYKNLNYRNILCHRFLVIISSDGTLEKFIHADYDPPMESQEPKWGLYGKRLIPLFIGDTTCTCKKTNP